MNRRDFLTGAIGLAGSVLLGACRTVTPPSDGPIQSILIDVHTHLFNGSDLPTVRFIKIVVLKHYPRQAIKTLDIDDPDALDGLIAMLTWIVGRTRAPTADAETKVLDRQAKAEARNAELKANESAVIDAIAAFVAQQETAVSDDISPDAVRKLRSSIFMAAGANGLAVSDVPLDQKEARLVAGKAYRSKVDLGLLLRWFALFTRYRYVLAEQLAADHRRQGFDSILLCPAAIDYDSWLGENVEESPLPTQVTVMGGLARRHSGPVVHGYVAYDPLRQAAFEAGRFTQFNPLELVRRAIRDEGFVGVKLYPPMGFKPYGNEADPCQTYPDTKIFRDLRGAAQDDPTTASCKPRPADGSRIIGQKLDKAMANLFDVCAAEDASILAHAADSNSAAEGYGRRADPAYWIPALRRWPMLRVALAHFGRFEARSASASPSSALPQASWEWALGQYLKEKPEAAVFADVSYLSEIAGQTPAERAAYAAIFRRWIDEFDPACRHLMFGTDWTMLGLDPSYEGYTNRLYGFFKETCKFEQAMLDRLFFGNAARFLGLRQGDRARERLLRFYDRHKVPRTRLPVLKSL
jgi:predicted TIM-barrel fold metal-dependent hydrolase